MIIKHEKIFEKDLLFISIALQTVELVKKTILISVSLVTPSYLIYMCARSIQTDLHVCAKHTTIHTHTDRKIMPTASERIREALVSSSS